MKLYVCESCMVVCGSRCMNMSVCLCVSFHTTLGKVRFSYSVFKLRAVHTHKLTHIHLQQC